MGLLVDYLLMVAYAQIGDVAMAADILEHMRGIVSSSEFDQAMLTDMEELYTALLCSLDSDVPDMARSPSPAVH